MISKKIIKHNNSKEALDKIINDEQEETKNKLEAIKLQNDMKKDNTERIGIAAKIGIAAATIGTYIYVFDKGIKFEEEGIYKSPSVKNLLGKINIFNFINK